MNYQKARLKDQLTLQHEGIDQTIWKTMPEMAKLCNATPAQIGRTLTEMGLWWRGPSDRWSTKRPTDKALLEGYAIKVDLSDYQDTWRWNYPMLFP